MEENDLLTRERKYFQLPVYRKAGELFNAFSQNTMKMPSWAQTQLVVPVKKDITDVFVYIGMADTLMERRGDCLVKCILILERMKYSIRMLRDLGSSQGKYLTPGGFGNIVRPLEELRRQLIGWAKSVGVDVKTVLPKTACIYTKREYIEIFIGNPTKGEMALLSAMGQDTLPDRIADGL